MDILKIVLAAVVLLLVLVGTLVWARICARRVSVQASVPSDLSVSGAVELVVRTLAPGFCRLSKQLLAHVVAEAITAGKNAHDAVYLASNKHGTLVFEFDSGRRFKTVLDGRADSSTVPDDTCVVTAYAVQSMNQGRLPARIKQYRGGRWWFSKREVVFRRLLKASARSSASLGR